LKKRYSKNYFFENLDFLKSENLDFLKKSENLATKWPGITSITLEKCPVYKKNYKSIAIQQHWQNNSLNSQLNYK